MDRVSRLSTHVAASTADAKLSSLMAPPELPVRDMNPEELITLSRDGVVHLRQVLQPQWVDRIREAVDEQASGQGPFNPFASKDELQVQASNSWHVNPKFHEIAMQCPTAHFAQQSLHAMSACGEDRRSKEVRFFYDQLFVKHASNTAPDIEGNTPWHHDITFWPVRGEEIITVWCPVDFTNLENGGLEFVLGSHTWKNRYKSYGVGIDFPSDVLEELPRLRSATNGDYDAARPPPMTERDAVSFDCEPGDVLIFSTLILHGAPPNRSIDRARRALALRYLGSGVVIDDCKHGLGTLLAPFTVFDENLSNGDVAGGYSFPRVLPTKDAKEVERRVKGQIKPSRNLMQRWMERKFAIEGGRTATKI